MSARPMLAEVLSVVAPLAGHPGHYRTHSVKSVQALGPITRPGYGCIPWAYATPAEAVEALIARDLLPPQWGDAARAPRWWCDRCEGKGDTMRECDEPVCRSTHDCFACDDGHTAAPPSLPALVAVASLGVDTLARVEAIVAETWRARLVWRAMTVAELDDHGERVYTHHYEPGESRAPRAAAIERHARRVMPAECDHADQHPSVIAAWPALVALIALGVHLLAVGDGRVTIGVEALG